jgi:hypothetical protein
VFIFLQRARRQTAYKPVFGDWLWHFILAFVAYATLTAAGFVEAMHAASALFAVAGGTTLLLFIGIHNAWDTVTYLSLERLRARQAKAREKAAQQKQEQGKRT